jgi:hypothetical protein
MTSRTAPARAPSPAGMEPTREEASHDGERPSQARHAPEQAPGDTMSSSPSRTDESGESPSLSAPPASEADDILGQRTTERSPQEWLAMLIRQAQAEQGDVQAPQVEHQPETPELSVDAGTPEPSSLPAAAPPPMAPSPSPLSESTRRFLKPLVSIDPGSVRVHRGPQADALTSSFGADAITIGDEVALSARHTADTPETLGLLAHELTHVARHREPRFVPPIAHGVDGRPVPRPTSPKEPRRSSQETSAEHPSLSIPSSEEELARRVEAETAALARTREEPPATRAIEPAPVPARPDPAPTGERQVISRRPVADPASAGRERRSLRSDWDGLPAPWEPLPEWLTAPSHSSEVATLPPPTLTPPPQQTGIPQQTTVQRAESGRTLEAESESVETGPAEPDSTAVEPDLDALARRVYTIVKRRLELERRRSR